MIVLDRRVTKWGMVLGISLCSAAIALSVATGVLCGVVVQERKTHLSALKMAEEAVKAQVEKIDQLECHILYTESIQKWNKNNWQQDKVKVKKVKLEE